MGNGLTGVIVRHGVEERDAVLVQEEHKLGTENGVFRRVHTTRENAQSQQGRSDILQRLNVAEPVGLFLRKLGQN